MTELQVLKTEELTISMGPQHPSTHGVLRLILRVDGEYIRDVKPDLGYLHRGMEKMAEERTYLQFLPLTDRFDYLSAMFNNMVYVRAVEKLGGVEVPERAEYIRVMMMELNRIASHLIFWGTFGLDLGALTPVLYAFREREKVLDLLEMVSGARMTFNYIRFGGVRADLPSGFIEKLKAFLDDFPHRVDDYDALLTGNDIFKMRTIGVGPLSAEKAVEIGVTGPMLRASGVPFDIRRAEPYSVYERFDFKIPTRADGDTFDRYVIRMEEMRQCVRILRQAMEQIPEGDVQTKVSRALKLPAGDVYTRIESPRGELGVYLVSDGGGNPYRFKLRAPSFINLQAIKPLAVGMKVGDLIAILGSIDIVLGEVDR
ncbi:MAG: NADH-quinone oxidoreductase subunit D [bacterium]